MKTIAAASLATSLLLATTTAADANVCASPGGGVAGAPIVVAATAQVEATYCSVGGAYTADLSLAAPDFQFIATGHVTAEGTTVDLGVFTGGSELVFAIYVRDTGDTFYSGDGSRNTDGRAHAMVTDLGNGDYHIGFEDIWGGGDNDFDDIQLGIHVRLDSDDDGLFDDEDACPATEAGGLVDDSGCSIADLCPCEDGWANHGAYVSCVSHAATDFRNDGLISGAERGKIVSAAAKSSCGK